MAKHRRSKLAAARDAQAAVARRETMDELERIQRIKLAEFMWGGFYYCPNTGKIIEALPGDDKVLCTCRRSNPAVRTEQTHLTGVHIIRFLKPASVEAYVAQEDARQADGD